MFDELQKLRNARNQLLFETDFYANTDVTMTDNMKACLLYTSPSPRD